MQDVDSGLLVRVELVVGVRGRRRERRPALLEQRRVASQVAAGHRSRSCSVIDGLIVLCDHVGREAQLPDGPDALWWLRNRRGGRGGGGITRNEPDVRSSLDQSDSYSTDLYSRDLSELFERDILGNLHTDAHERVRDGVEPLPDRVLHALVRHGCQSLLESLSAPDRRSVARSGRDIAGRQGGGVATAEGERGREVE